MQSWLSRSAEPGAAPDAAMVQRFVEASRRAEIVALVNSATSEREIAEVVATELCEAFDAEVAFVVAARDAEAPLELIAATGVPAPQRADLPRDPLLALGLGGGEALQSSEDLQGLGTRAVAVAPFRADGGGSALVGVARLYPLAFEAADVALLEAVTKSTGHALERAWLAQRTDELYSELEETYVGTASALAAALEAKDDYTAEHAQSIAALAVEVGRDLDLDERELRNLRYGAIFHDIGKIAVPDAILNKPGRLTDEEWDVIKRHPIAGEQILAPVPFLADVRRIVRHDHERWDGRGYPDGLAGDEIPIGARIVFVVDAYHAMVSDRPYRSGMSDRDARAELCSHAGTQFDPSVVAAFLAVLDRRQRLRD
jgi:HD-GYP domain-containing protein (c-di-GMP phosphodiesterase class II)